MATKYSYMTTQELLGLRRGVMTEELINELWDRLESVHDSVVELTETVAELEREG